MQVDLKLECPTGWVKKFIKLLGKEDISKKIPSYFFLILPIKIKTNGSNFTSASREIIYILI